MNYPVWDVATTGGGLLIAIVATIHVYAAHFAVGGGLFLVLTEQKAYREGNQALVEYVHKHTRFFLLLTMVFGALTGVGIWLTISAIHPGATSLLIHNFVFGWASEWVFFVVEIVSLLIYYYTFGKMNQKDHLRLGWIYFIAAWISLVIINGIVSFMLTPGDWLKTRSFWDGILNPSFWPSLFFRTALAVMFAGLYGFITSVNLSDPEFRQKMLRYCARWVILPVVLLAPTGWWYFSVIPQASKAMLTGGVLDPAIFGKWFLIITAVVVAGGAVMALKLSHGLQKGLTICLMVVGLLSMGAFEYVRETSRRPYIIYGHMYSNGLVVSQVEETRAKGVLASARWSALKEVTEENKLKAGKELFKLLCVSCHSMGGPRNDILVQMKDLDEKGILATMSQMGKGRPFMPPFPGNEKEMQALTSYLISRR